MLKAFLSYRDDDAGGHAGRLHDALEARLGAGSIYKFKDEDRQAGAQYVPRILQAIAESEWVLVVIGRSWMDAEDPLTGRPRLADPHDLVRMEVATALEHGRPVVPVLVSGASMPRAVELPTGLELLAYYEAFSVSDDRWQTDVAGLIEALTARGMTYAQTAAQLASSGQLDAAKLAYSNAIESGHSEAAPRAWIGLASLCYREGDRRRAEQMFQKAIAEFPNPDHVALAQLHFGWCLQEAGKLSQAEACLTEAKRTVASSAGLLRVIDAQLEYVRWKRGRRKAKVRAGGMLLAMLAASMLEKGEESASESEPEQPGEVGGASAQSRDTTG